MADQTKQDNKDAQESGQPVQLDKEQQGGQQNPGHEQLQDGKEQEQPAK